MGLEEVAAQYSVVVAKEVTGANGVSVVDTSEPARVEEVSRISTTTTGGEEAGEEAEGLGGGDYDKPQRNRDASVNIRGDWVMKEEIDFNRLTKLNLETSEGEDVDQYGFPLLLRPSLRQASGQEHRAKTPASRSSSLQCDHFSRSSHAVPCRAR